METLGQFLERVTAEFGSSPALLYKPRYRTETWTYTQLWEHTTRVAWWLRARGVGKGDRVVLWAPNSPWWVAAFFGLQRVGAVCVPLDIRSSPDFVHNVVAQSEPKFALLSPLTRDAWEQGIPTCTLDEMVRGLPEAPPPWNETITPSDIAEIMFTSGTTGDPKGVVLTHGNITANAAGVTQVIPDLPYFRLLSILPLSHMFEQTVGLVLPLNRGASVFYPASRQSSILFRAFAEQRITTVLAVPQALQLFIDAIERQVRKSGRERLWRSLNTLAPHLPRAARKLLFRSVHRRLGGELQFFVSGGAAIDAELVRRWNLFGIPIVQGYGATETAPVITATTLTDTDPRTVGKPVPGVSVRLAPDGEVLVQGPNVALGYWNNLAATEESFGDGWYRTGDLGLLDHSGRLYLKGRKKNLIVLPNGQNVYPEDVERALVTLHGVDEAVVVGLSGPQGQEVHAVLLSTIPPDDPGALIRQANAMLAPHQRIDGFSLWPEPDFPRTHTLKIKRQDVLARVENRTDVRTTQHPSPARSESPVSPLTRLIVEASGGTASPPSPDATLGDVGLDSLARVELLSVVEAELGVYLDESKVDATTSVAELERMVETGQSTDRPVFPTWPRGRIARATRAVLQRAAFALLGRLAPTTVVGTQNLDGIDGPVLFVANHTSHLDSVLLLSALPVRHRRRVAVAAAADYFFARPPLGSGVALLLNAFPFSRTTAVRPTLEHCATLLDTKWSILLYPEGTRSVTGTLGDFKAGVGLLAVELEVPVVPVHLDGLQRILPKGRTLPRRGPVAATFGRAMTFDGSTPYGEVALRLEDAVRALQKGSPAAEPVGKEG
jgi:long-chain acyl-CoA synthetase